MYHWVGGRLRLNGMHYLKRWLLFMNIVGGAAVLGSYAWGLGAHPGAGGALWGGTPEAWRRVSTANMPLAALGYFAFTFFILFRLVPEKTLLFGRFGYAAFNGLYAAILLPSALWMPLTFAALASPNPLSIWSVRVALVIIGLASLGLMMALSSLSSEHRVRGYYPAVIGCAFFCLQTVFFDASVWSAFFQP